MTLRATSTLTAAVASAAAPTSESAVMTPPTAILVRVGMASSSAAEPPATRGESAWHVTGSRWKP